MSWSRAVWQEDKQEEESVIPSHWIQHNVVRWPKVSNAVKYVKDRCKPSTSWWKFPLVKVKFTSESYQECEELLTTEAEADVTDETATQRKRRKVLHQDFIAPSDVESDEPVPKKLSHGLLDLGSFPPPPPQKYNRKTVKSSVSQLSDNESSTRQSTDRAPSTSGMSQARQLSDESSTRQSTDRAPSTSGMSQALQLSDESSTRQSTDRAPSTSGMSQAQFQKRVLYQLALLSKEVRELRTFVERQSSAISYLSDELPDLSVTRGPLTTVAAVTELNQKCDEDSNVRQFLFNLLSKCCGSSLKETVKSVMNRLCTNQVMSYISMNGRNLGKIAFGNLPICTIVVDSVMHNHTETPSTVVRRTIWSYLKMAPYRLGGAGKGATLMDAEPSCSRPPQSDSDDDSL